MGYTSTFKFVNLGIRRRVFRRLHRQPHHQWEMTKNQLDSLIKYGRIETTVAKAKELQQYAEEIVHFAKKDTPEADLIVESMLRTPQSRRKLYEELVPRYADRHFYVTRIINQWKFRMRDSAPLAFIEFVDRPGELRPANPVGFERTKYIWEQMQLNRRNFRRYKEEAMKRNLMDENGWLIADVNAAKRVSAYEWRSDNDEEGELALLESGQEGGDRKSSISTLRQSHSSTVSPPDMPYEEIQEGGSMGRPLIDGPKRGIEQFYIDLPPPSEREKTDYNIRKRYKP